MIRLYIPFNHSLNQEILDEEFYLVESLDNADYILAQSTLPLLTTDLSKVIYVAVEPPLADHRLFCYSNFDKFKLVVTHNKDKNQDNQINFTDSDEPQYFPVKPISDLLPFVTREDTTLKNRGIFYMGMVGGYEHVKNSFGGINLTIIRRLLGEHFIKEKKNKIIGIGWNGQRTKVKNWRVDKQEQIKEFDCDFVLALENTMLPNYLYEKIWDGFISDRVTLYLGDPNIEKHIPLNCFIDLRKYFNKETGEIDVKSIQKRLDTISQKEYNEILSNARKFRETAIGRYKELQDKLTRRIVNCIKN